jgi:putative acetyltransferase
MLIRREQSRDVEGIAAVTTAAHRRAPDSAEPPATQLVARLRGDSGWLPALSLVAIAEDIVIGHVVCTRGHVDDAPALGLAPISVLPERQGRGVGHALMHAVLGAAEATDEPLVCLLGEPAFSQRFGFAPASELGILAPNPHWGSYFQARPLSCYSCDLTGTFGYAVPFAELDLS